MADETEEPGPEQSFLSHLVELRQRIVRAAVAIVIVFIPMAFFMQQIFDFLSRPMMRRCRQVRSYLQLALSRRSWSC